MRNPVKWVQSSRGGVLLRFAKQILGSMLVPAATALGQLSGGIGPIGHVSTAASTWRSTAALSGVAKLDRPLVSLGIDGALLRTSAGRFLGNGAAHAELFTPAAAGLRGIAVLDVDKKAARGPLGESATTGSLSLSYRRGNTGSWLGVRGDRGTTAALRVGGWRDIADWLTVAVSSTLRRASVGGSAARAWTETFKDSVLTDSGWVPRYTERTYGDSGSAGRRTNWLETEARLAWTVGRVAFDGVVGWRPAIDTTKSASWFRGIGTIGVARHVSLSAGVGTTTRQVPFARQTGRYAMLALRLAPAALVRPRETPEITPAASSFTVARADGQYMVRVRLPRARTVELSGDFNGWQPTRLTRELDGSWVIMLDLKPGAHRMNLRVDGERWLPPPGSTAVDDEFNGKVGLVVVR
jgi:hypothetical protein